MQTIKSIARAPWGSSGPRRSTWYEPLVDQADIDLAVHWVLGSRSLPQHRRDVELLPRVLDAAARFGSRPDEAEMARLLSEQRLSTLFV